MLENDLIKVATGPTTWISPIVPVPKSDGLIRIFTDAREPNKALVVKTALQLLVKVF